MDKIAGLVVSIIGSTSILQTVPVSKKNVANQLIATPAWKCVLLAMQLGENIYNIYIKRESWFIAQLSFLNHHA